MQDNGKWRPLRARIWWMSWAPNYLHFSTYVDSNANTNTTTTHRSIILHVETEKSIFASTFYLTSFLNLIFISCCSSCSSANPPHTHIASVTNSQPGRGRGRVHDWLKYVHETVCMLILKNANCGGTEEPGGRMASVNNFLRLRKVTERRQGGESEKEKAGK